MGFRMLDHLGAEGLVDEAGASVDSASELAGEELPELDLTLRGAVSIARRLQDPLEGGRIGLPMKAADEG